MPSDPSTPLHAAILTPRGLLVASVLALAATSGCSSAPAVLAGGPSIVGGWVLEGESCESDAGVVYQADGTFGAYDISGDWRLEGDRLMTTIRKRGEPGTPMVSLRPPERHAVTILSISDKAHQERWEDGSVHTYNRCP